MTETTVGREPIQIVEIQQPFCSRTYGVAPCTASGPAGLKCFNTRSTCQDAANFLAGTPLSLFFSRGRVGEQVVTGADYIIPSLVSVSTSPTKINLAGADPDAEGLGNRALCSVTFLDHPHTDRIVDLYVSGRGYDPMTRGSFWTKWIARNRYRQNIVIAVYEGYVGQALTEMYKRTYFLTSVQGPDASGQVTITGKDILARLEERKAQAPIASPGVLYADILAAGTTFRVAGALLADYPAAGTVRIDSEIIKYTARALVGDQIEFTGLTRGSDDSVAADHDVNTQVQLCLRIEDMRVDTALQLLMETYGGIHTNYLDLTGWAEETDAFLGFWRLWALITEPTAVSALVNAIQEQVLVNCWWDERLAKVKLQAVRGVTEEPTLLTEEYHIVAGSFDLREEPDQRVSQVWVYYAQRDKTRDVTDETNYKEASVIANLVEEALYDELSVRKIYGTFLKSAALANTTASKIITRYVHIPSTVRFQLDAKDRSIWVGSTVRISHSRDVDKFGNRQVRQWYILSAEEVEYGELIQYEATDTSLYGRLHYVMAAGSPDYPGAALAPYKNCYIGDANGLLSDGSSAGRIS